MTVSKQDWQDGVRLATGVSAFTSLGMLLREPLAHNKYGAAIQMYSSWCVNSTQLSKWGTQLSKWAGIAEAAAVMSCVDWQAR